MLMLIMPYLCLYACIYTFIILCTCAGMFSGCKGEEVQTTDWKGDETSSIDSPFEDKYSEPHYFPVTEGIYPDLEERSKRSM